VTSTDHLDRLGDFIGALDRAGELRHITQPVAARLELCEISDRVMKQPGGGQALLFEHVILDDGTRASCPVAINLFGSMRRMSIALGVESLDDIARRITALLDLKVPEGILAKLALVPRLLDLAKFPPRVRGGPAPCQSVVYRGDDVDLRRLPVLTCWPQDGGPYITLPMVISRDPVRGVRNVGMYRVQVLGPRTVAMHWQRHKVGAAHWRAMAERGETMPVCIVVGADPASVYAASAPLPPTVDELLFAGFLRQAPVSLTRALTTDLEVPAEAEFVLEGYIDPRESLVTEGPFGDHTGFYSEADLYPAVHVTALTSRRTPVYATTIVGRPPMEDYYLGHATERIFLPLLRLTIPEIVDYHMPAEGIFHNLVFVAIDKQYPGQAFKVMNALWGQGLMSLAKLIIVVDKDVNVQNPAEAWWVALNHIDPERDARFTMGPIDVLDHASRAFTYGSKLGLDATRKWPEEGATRRWPDRIVMDAATRARVDALWPSLGLDNGRVVVPARRTTADGWGALPSGERSADLDHTAAR
jgi:4-hydroxy-3-polyprenylbenzoate decarboxylase